MVRKFLFINLLVCAFTAKAHYLFVNVSHQWEVLKNVRADTSNHYVDLTYVASCSIARDTVSFNYTIDFKTNAKKTFWIDPIEGYKEYNLEVYDDTGNLLTKLSSVDRTLGLVASVETNCTHILIKSWFVCPRRKLVPVMIYWKVTSK